MRRPSGIPASATIWAEVVDGLGRKVGAWFDPDGLDEGHCVRMVNSNHSRDFFTWAPSWDADWHPGGTYRCPSAAAQCRQLYERGMAEQEKTDRAARLAAQANGLCGECKTRRYDPKSNIAMCTECLATVDFPGPEWRQEIREEAKDLAETKPRPACIPSHIADTDWTVIEGRAVWRVGVVLYIEDSREDAGPWVAYSCDLYHRLKLCADVPQSLFLAARRWMGWENEEPTIEQRLDAAKQACEVAGNALLHLLTVKEEALTRDRDAWKAKAETLTAAVDLTELREAWNDYMPGLTPLPERIRPIILAVESLLSGGAP